MFPLFSRFLFFVFSREFGVLSLLLGRTSRVFSTFCEDVLRSWEHALLFLTVLGVVLSNHFGPLPVEDVGTHESSTWLITALTLLHAYCYTVGRVLYKRVLGAICTTSTILKSSDRKISPQ